MNHKTEKEMRTLLDQIRHKKSRNRIMKILAIGVVLATAGMLIIPAVTMEKKPLCGLEEHTHSAECYKEEKKLICGMEEVPGHQHTEACKKQKRTLICELPEKEGHRHTASCYEIKRTLTCTLPEGADHTHTDSCYTEEKILICELPEEEGHKHDDSCYRMEEIVCGLEEQEPGHIHTDACYETVTTLICKKPEHKHTENCYEQSNPEADVETENVWKKSVEGAELTKNWGTDLIEVASTQLGYKESTKNFIWDEEGNKKGYTRYGDWYGDRYGHWCAMFISFCMEHARIPEEVVPREASCRRWIQDLQNTELYETSDISTPVPGDLIFFDRNHDDISEHVGIVKEVVTNEDKSKVRTIEGNTGGNVVKEKEYSLYDDRILGYGKVTKAQERYEKLLAANAGKAEFTFENEDVTVTLSLSGLTEFLPEDTKLEVKKLTTDNSPEFYQEVVNEATKEIKDKKMALSNINVFDMKLVSGGEKLDIQPYVEADVRASFHTPLFEKEEAQQAAEFRTFSLEEPEKDTKDTTEKPLPAEVEGSYSGVQDGITEVAYTSKGVTPFAVTLANKTESGKFWKQIRNSSEIQSFHEYIIVSAEGNYALTNNRNTSSRYNYTPIVMEPVKGNPDYYRISQVPTTARWTYTPQKMGNSFVTRIDLRYQQIFVDNNQAAALTINNSRNPGCWEISTYDSYYGYRYYLNKAGGDFMSSSYRQTLQSQVSYQYSKTSDMLILEEVDTTLTIPEDAVERVDGTEMGTAEKPSYPAYINVSGEKTGTYDAGDGITGTYASDPSTSQIENSFGHHPRHGNNNDYEAQKVDNGKALMDKSVIYKADDYQAFDSYEEGTFGVTLSALGQVFDTNTEEVKIPMDVLFILDMSNSMNEYDSGQSQNRAQILVEAVNNTIDQIMKIHPDNRVCAVGYNSQVQELMELDRYAPSEYLKYDQYNYEHGRIIAPRSQKGLLCENGTYTQLGIAKGVEVMNRRTDTDYPVTIGGETKRVPRKPVVILISDGEPTHCTSHYMDVMNNPYYGDGIAQEYNAKGVQGYYTILSANYYKRMVGIHYDNPALMFTVAFGMKEKDFSREEGSIATTHYRATIMKPTAENIELLRDSRTTQNVEGMLYDLLKGNYGKHDVQIGARLNLINGRLPNTIVPINQVNAYRGDYNYADRAYLGNTGYDGVAKALNEIVNISKVVNIEYSYETQADKSLILSDPIGAGMEVKGDPVLRYNGTNYRPTAKQDTGNATVYSYSGVVPMDPHSGRKIDLSTIKVRIERDSSGRQKVVMEIPPDTLPVYAVDKTMSFYYESLPVRLTYQVGLSISGREEIQAMSSGETKTFYTNSYTGGEHAEGRLDPSVKNPYYKQNGWQKNTDKTANPTGTDSTSLELSGNRNHVTQRLGNNGKLTFTRTDIPGHELSVQKKWLDYDGKEKTKELPKEITADLYRTYIDESGKKIREDVVKDFKLSEENGWKKTFTPAELNEVSGREYQYYVNEKSVEGYKVSYSNDGVAETTPEDPILITNRYIYGDFILPESGGPGTTLFTGIGMALIAVALVFGYVLRQKRGERRNRAS